MTDYAIHSPNDGLLLIKFHDQLVKHGIDSYKDSHKYNPLNGYDVLMVFDDKSIYYEKLELFKLFYSMQKYLEITPENFNSVLNEVLQNFGINV